MSRRRAGGSMVEERRVGTGGRRAAATDQIVAGEGGSDRIARHQSPPGRPASAAEGNGEG